VLNSGYGSGIACNAWDGRAPLWKSRYSERTRRTRFAFRKMKWLSAPSRRERLNRSMCGEVLGAPSCARTRSSANHAASR